MMPAVLGGLSMLASRNTKLFPVLGELQGLSAFSLEVLSQALGHSLTRICRLGLR